MTSQRYRQEVQLSQRDRAMLCVIEISLKSLKVIRNKTPVYRACVTPY